MRYFEVEYNFYSRPLWRKGKLKSVKVTFAAGNITDAYVLAQAEGKFGGMKTIGSFMRKDKSLETERLFSIFSIILAVLCAPLDPPDVDMPMVVCILCSNCTTTGNYDSLDTDGKLFVVLS